MRKPLLFLPGPMQVPDFVRAAGDRPLFNHRSPQMLELLARLETGCRPLFGTKGDVVFLASSGSGAMESAVVNMTSPGEEVIVAGIKQWPNAQVVFHTWSESSTGVLNEMSEIGKLIRSQNKLFVADAVSGLAVSPMHMDDWNIDAVVVGSQKGLMVSPGLGVVAIGERAWEKSANSKTPRFYFDWRKLKGTVPFTPALSLLFELEGSLDFIHSQGMDKIFLRRAQIAERIRDLVRRSGMEVYALNPGNGITGVIPSKGFDMAALRRRLESDFGIQIAGGLGKVKDTMFRIGHVGHATDEEVEYFIQSFERCLAG
jgi:aspartate aminotransferase-like enzyme